MSEFDELNSARNEFAGLWQSRPTTEPPDLSEFLRNHPSLTPRQLADICKVDQNRRWASSQGRIVEQYLADAPELAEHPELKLELVVQEFLCRQQQGELPDLHSFCLRFPDMSDALQSQLVTLNEPASSPPPIVYPSTLVTPSKLESLENALPSRFHFQKIIASGAFGVVIGAHDTKLERVVALKIPLANLKSRRDRETFRADALALAKLDHPHIVPLFDMGELLDGRCFLVMKLVAGQDLARRMLTGPVSVDQVKAWLIPIAEALHHAHQKGIAAHRDVKPANILIDESGTTYLTDFGLAITDEQQRKVRHEQAGSLSWMSPEQIRAESHYLDGRSDIWSLGVVLYQALTGQLPFQGPTNEVIREEILHRPPKPPRQLNDAISPQLELICLRCLEKSATKRFTTALDLANALRDDRSSAATVIPDDALRIVMCREIEQEPFPVYQVTLHNLLARAVILTELKVDVTQFQPRRHVSTRELLPTSRWDVKIPAQKGLMFHKPRHPILIAPGDAAVLELRLSCVPENDLACHPADLGGFRLRFTFYAGADIEITTEDVTIGEITG